MNESIFDKKNILIIGGAGFIGSHLCDELIKKNKIICIDNFSSGDEKNIDHLLADENFRFVKHDMEKPIDLEALPELENFKVAFQGIQEIYNLACPTSPKNFENDKIANLLANSLGIKNALDLAVKYKAKFMHFSSSVVYGPRTSNEKIDENHLGAVDQLSARSSYDEGKRFAETMAINYQVVYNLDLKIIRLFRTYGPRMKLNDNQMIPDFINFALDNEPLIIYGDQDFSSSFCYISDVIDATTKIIEKDGRMIINIGSDTLIKFSDLAKMIIKIIGSKSPITYQDPILFMTPLALPNIHKALNEVGWLPVVTLEKGLEKTIYDLRASKGIIRYFVSFQLGMKLST
jgi:UDP-glucuronate decarboxylase